MIQAQIFSLEMEAMTEVPPPEMFRNNTERDSFINMLARTHNFVRNSVEKSGVSLRDVNRVILLYKWFNQKIQELKRLKENDKTITPAQMQYLFDPEKIWLRAATCALYLAYGLRMNGNYKVQRDLKDKMVDSITNNGLKFSEISATLEMMADIYLEKLREATNNRAIPQNVAINTPLKENFITMLACFDTYIPLIICGAPGTSKTLCSQIFDSALISSIIRSDRTKEFSTYQAIYSLYYGGSVTSTADGISKVYKRAQLYLEKKGEDRPVVIFDEIGLAELSPYNPLKVLHPLLEDEKLKVGFFGISNWTLDLSKMNRLIYLARPDMSVDDLRNIFQISINACKDPQVKAKLEYYLNIMANAYIELRKWQKVYSLHRDFHGSRDVYAVAKFMYNHIAKADSEANSALLIKYAIERNLNGWAYYFTPQTQPSDKGEKYLEIPFETIPGLDKFQATKEFDALRSLRIGDMGSPYDEKLPGDEALLRGKTIFSSSQVFKQIFVRLLKEASTKKVQGAAVTFNESLFGSSFMKETLVMEQIATNLRDSNSRFLLIRSEGEVVDNDFMDRLYKIMGQLNRRQDIVDWRGIKGKENSIDLLTTLKSYITDGKIVVMKNLDELHGSLYDLFNQKYTDIEGLKYCYLYFGESKHRVQVHPDFKTIVLLDAEKQLSREQIEKEQQAPFLNRFEKYFVSMANLQESEYDIKYIFHLVRYVQKIINNRPFRILGMSLDMLTSIYNRSKLVGRDRGPAEQTKEIRRLIFRMATSNLLLKEGLTNKEGDGDLALFEQEHEFDSLKDLLKSFVTDMKTTSRACVFTFSNPLELDPLKKTMEKNPERYRILTDEFLVTQGIEQRTSTLKKMTEPFLFVQFTKPINLELIASLKTSVRQNTNIKKCLLLFHLSRDYAQSEKINSNVGINFRDGWENYVIEYVNKNCYKDLVSSYGMSLTRLMSSDERDNKLELSVRLAKACTYRTLQMLSDSQSDKTLKDNFQQIQMMLNRDENNVYINELMTVIKRFTFDDSLWRRYVQQERFKLSVAEQRNYVDIQEAIQNVIFNSKRDDSSTESAVSIELIMRKFMIFINGELKNLASYAKYYNSDIEEKKLLYRNRFQMNLRIPLKEDLLNANHTFDHYLVPFYKYKYEKFFANYTSKRIEGNTSTVKQLKEAEMQFYHLRKQAGGQGNNAVLTSLREKIKRSETRLEEAMEELISEMVNQDSTEDNNNIMFDEFCSDLAIGMFRKIDVHQINTREDKIFEMKAKNKQMQELLYKNEEFFNLFCEKMCQRKYPLKKDMFADLITLYSILSICYFEDIAVILKMAEISNVKRKDLEDILAKINSRKDSQNSTGFRFQYDLISKVKMELENRAFPDFEDRDFDLIKCKNTYATIAAMKRDDNEVDIESNYNIRFLLILIDLILLLDRGSQSSKGDEIQAKRKTMIQQNIELTYKSIRDTFILPILKNDWRALLYNKSESHLKALTLVLSELFIAEAECGDFTTFADNQLKELLHELDTVLEKEKKYVNTIPSQLASYVANLIPEVVCLKDLEHLLALINNRPDEMSEGNKQDDDAKNTVDLVVRERVQNVSKSLISKLNISGNKAHKEFAIAFSDKLTFRFFEKATSSRPDGQRLLLEDDKMLELLKYFAKDARFTNESNGKTSLQNILFGATLRFLFKSGLMNYLEDPNIISQVESLQYLSFDFSSPNALLENRNLLPVLYYLQEYYLSQLGAQDKGTHLKLIEDANNELIRVKHSNNIVFFSKGITKMLKSVENVMKVPDDQKSKFFADFSKDHNLNACFLVGVAIINELDFETKSENSSPDQLKNFANKALQELFAKPSDDMNSIKQYFESLVKNMMDPKTIQSLSYSTTQAEDQKADGEGNQAKRTEDSEESVDEFKFRQLLYQFILTVTCFQPVFNYDLELAKSWLKKMDQSRLKLPLASNDKLTNMGVVFETILVTRLSDGSYQDYGEELCKNLGIYQCVCKYVYTIGQCGYAVSTDTCPSCGRPIGGKDHRTNNTNIKTLQELQSLIRDEYMKVKSEYQLHTPINTSHPALALIKLLELKTQEEILSYLQQTHVHASTRYYDHLLFMRHLWDHMYLLLCPELIGSQGKGADPFFAQFDQMIQKSKSKSKDNKDQLDYFFENKKIGNSKQYLMTHIKNDLNQLRAVLGLKNNAQVIDFLRVSLIKIGEKLMNKEVTDSGNDLAKLIDFNDLDNPLELLRSYQTNIDDTFGEGMNKLEQAELLKDLVYSKDITSKLGISPSLPTFQLHYDLLRHNVLGKDMILRQFKEKLKTTKRKFLRALVEDNQIILKHFPKIMDAHVKLGLYFNIKYEKAFQIQDLKSLTVGDLQPADQTLENYLKDLVQVWREQLQMSEYQQKLNYSFECEENIEMEDFYSDITQNELQDVPLNNLALSSAASTKLSVAVQSLLKSVHNKYVKEINLILGIEALEQKEQKKLEDCTEEDYMSCFDFESVVLNNFWFNPNIEKQDEINFDFNKIEYICAKFMKKSLINPTPKNYKENSDDVTDDRQNIEKFINDLPFKRLPEEIERRMRELKDNELANTYKFFCEMAVHGFNMVMGTNLNQTMTDIVKEASHGGSFSKFKYFDSSLHGSITLEYLPHCFRIVKEGRMNYFIDLNSQDWTSVKNQYKFTNFEDEIFNKLVETMSQMRQDRNMAQAKQIVRGLLDAMVDFVHYELVDHIEGRNPDPIKVICAKQFSSERNFSRNISKNLGIRSDLAEEISEMRVCQIEMIKDRLISELNDLISRH
jgi:hypothetical protein